MLLRMFRVAGPARRDCGMMSVPVRKLRLTSLPMWRLGAMGKIALASDTGLGVALTTLVSRWVWGRVFGIGEA